MDIYRETAITAIVTVVLIIVLLWMYDVIYELHTNLNTRPQPLGHTSQSELQLQLVPLGQYGKFSNVGQCRHMHNRQTQSASRAASALQELEYRSCVGEESAPTHRRSRLSLPKVPSQLKIRPNESQQKGFYTPFLTACWECDIFNIGSLIHEGVDIHQKTIVGETGLVLATYQMAKKRRPWNPMCLDVLVYNGCSINEPTNVGNTALHIAVKQGHLAVTKWLLQHGASVSTYNNAGWRPEAIALAQRRHDILDLLQEADSAENCSKTEDAEKGSKVKDEENSSEAEEAQDSMESDFTKDTSAYDHNHSAL